MQPANILTQSKANIYQTKCSIHARLDELSKLADVTGRLDVVGEDLRTLLANKTQISTHAINPFAIALHVGSGQS